MNCPTCQTPNERTARSCATCGTSLGKGADSSFPAGSTPAAGRRMTIAERRAAGISGSGPDMAAGTKTAAADYRSAGLREPAVQSPDRTNPFAITAMILGIIGGSVLAIAFGFIAKSQIRRTGERGSGMATAGIVLGFVWAAAILAYFIWALSLISSMSVLY